MQISSIISSVAVAAALAFLTGCGSTTKVTTTNEVSVGQQLSDLERARVQGIITDKEYLKLKKALINRYD